jgi:transcription antitermination factor NusG
MNENKKWYALYTRPRWEKKVAENLSKKKIDNYCPLNKVVRQWSDRKKIIHEPLFTSYVFVHASEKEHTALRQVSGVINMVYWLGKPAVIADYEIDSVKRFLSEHTNVLLQKTPINAEDRIRVLSGPLMSLEGQVISVKNRTVKISLPSLGYMMYVEVETNNLEVMPKTYIPQAEVSYPMYAAQ